MQIAFSQRPASVQWEPFAIGRVPGLTLWAWFRPQHLPSGVTISMPADVVAAYPNGLPFTVNDLLLSAGVLPNQFQAVSLPGQPWQSAAAFGPFLNHAVPVAAPGVSSEIGLSFLEQIAMPQAYPGFAAMPGSMPAEDFGFDETTAESKMKLYDRIESSWKAAVQMERQMTGTRKKLSGILNSLNKLDRELTPEERLSADREDKDNWEDARRWARDLASKCHREIKQFDIGMTSSAGRRNSIQQVYQEIIETRQPCGELEAHHRDFQTYRKDMTNLQRAMTTAAQAASQNGTQRCQRVLSSIQKKIQERRRRMREPIGGTNMDKSCRRKR